MTGGEASPLRGERLIALDFIRGIAVLGILLANILPFGHPMVVLAWPEVLQVPRGPWDDAYALAQAVFVDGKMRGLFTLLFGAGMVIFVTRAGEKGAGRELQLRRLGWLALFGLFHFYVLFRGDILFSYAVCGVIALAAVDWDARRQLGAGLALYVLGGVLLSAMLLPEMRDEAALLAACPQLTACPPGFDVAAYDGARELVLDEARVETEVMLSGFGTILAYNLGEELFGPFDLAFFALFETLPLMLVGMGMLRLGLLSDARAIRARLPWALGGIGAGVALTLPLALWVWAEGDPLYLSFFVFAGVAQLARLPMVLGLAVALAWLAPRVADGALGARLIAAGRMAFTNYLGTSLVMAAIFQGWGLGLFGTMGRMELLVPVLLGWAVMLAWSKPWLERFEYGPLEWLWRCLTYRRLCALRRTA